MIVINNRDYNIDQNNRDYNIDQNNRDDDFGHNRAAPKCDMRTMRTCFQHPECDYTIS